ncbi:hypothetical protein L2E82_12606 [Cichorium intybus]|uniref:Uncharacterized protein n=1 Tax=Cichorium intybus TaxID=13427 RepID=A0ACB9GHR1_CICIN|nr:hypothetical protein L2E82_12606 [Cichorium intybus]
MARVSKTNPFHARRLAESRANNEGQEQSEETQTESTPEEDDKSSLSSEEEWQEEEKKRKGKAPMKKPGKRGRGNGRSPAKIPETSTSPKRGRGRGRKTTFAVKSALYDVEVSQQEEVATTSDPKGKGKEKVQETDEFEEDEACKRITHGRNMDDDRYKDDDVMPGLTDINI